MNGAPERTLCYLKCPLLTRMPAEDCWRSVILFGRSVASYKFALTKSLLELADRERNFISPRRTDCTGTLLLRDDTGVDPDFKIDFYIGKDGSSVYAVDANVVDGPLGPWTEHCFARWNVIHC